MLQDGIRLGLLVVALALPICAQHEDFQRPEQWISVSKGNVPSAPELFVKTDGGSVRIEGHSGSVASYNVRIRHATALNRAESADSPYKIASYVRGRTTFLIAKRSFRLPSVNTAEVVLDVPKNLQLVKVVSVGGKITVLGIRGRVQLLTGGGEISLDDIEGAIDAQTGGLDIDAGRAGSSARLRTGGGRISVRLVKGNLQAWTGGGNILVGSGMSNTALVTGAGAVHIELCGGELKVVDGGGNVVLGQVEGAADIRLGGGNIRLRSAKGAVQAHTTAGNIDLQSVPAANARTEVGSISVGFTSSRHAHVIPNSSLQTSMGDISVYLPRDLPITIQASVDLGGSHVIDCDFPQIRVSSEPDEVDRMLFAEGKLNGGGPVLRIHASNGNIRIKRQQERQQ